MLKIGKFLISNYVNGPGRRFVIWFQGCPIRCKGCFNPEFWDEDGGISMSVEELISEIKFHKEIEGVTFTGGEPLVQGEDLLSLSKLIKSMGLSIVCYTGYLLEDILADKVPKAKDILSYVDILIDGPYVEAEKDSLIWRGSRNQRVHFLTDRYLHLKPFVEKRVMEAEIQIGEKGIFITGIFDRKIWENLKREMGK